MQFSEMHTFGCILIFIVLCHNSGAAHIKLIAKRISEALPEGSLPAIRPTPSGNCLKLQCKYICFNGKSTNIEEDIAAVENSECKVIDELHIYNYEFPYKKIPLQFLGEIANHVKQLSIYASNVEIIENGAFESQTLTGVHLEDLKLINVHRGFFKNVAEKFTTFTLIQLEKPVENVDENFLEDIKYQIKKLTIQTGLITVKNITNSNCLLNNLEEVNLSNNNFMDRLRASSFNQLSMVESLNLSNSQISHLPESIFTNIVATLKSLDLSDNKLKMISQNVFGWRDLSKGLVINLHGNPWECSCELRTEMIVILAYQTEKVYCETPQGMFVTQKDLCYNGIISGSCLESQNQEACDDEKEGGGGGESLTNPPSLTSTMPISPTKAPISSTNAIFDSDSPIDINETVRLECQKQKGSEELEPFSIQWPRVQFEIEGKKSFEVDIVVNAPPNGTYGILWFSKVTTQYSNMEVNYKEYGLGCYGYLEYVTTIQKLLPDTSYTFCMVLKDELTVSPFSCKSTYIGGNLDIKYNAWLTTKMRATGISLVVLGIVLFKFFGILLVFLLIKRKPTLVKGSKRVALQKNDSTNIIVFPEDKTLQKFQEKEEQIAKRNSMGSSLRRLSTVSNASLDSNQSYMNPVNPNIYEIIPAYQRYLPAYCSEFGADVSYAEIPLEKKRTSTDPLPAVPSTPTVNLRNLTTDGSSV